ncbi:SPJ_0845 family protein [Vagococcus jeotgali]|uniref:SPJ_0845 family protein n=1 Tax=Vagococcus jeotgali TaxID=3109030 RepID=UPI002DD81813|nr:SPJ_0845 family protein [Vagococcus sp. B2T-5]
MGQTYRRTDSFEKLFDTFAIDPDKEKDKKTKEDTQELIIDIPEVNKDSKVKEKADQ